MKNLFYDLETTGTKHWKNGIHQISGLIEINGEVVKEFDFKVRPNPKAEIEDKALEVGRVTRDQILAYPEMQVVYKELSEILDSYVNKYDRSDKFFLVGYNNRSFDDAFFRAFFVQNHDEYFGSRFFADSHDLIVLASYYLKSHRTKLPDFKLSTVAKFLGVEVDETKLHDATYDLYLTRSLYYKLIQTMSPLERVMSVIDAKRGLIREIKAKNPKFHAEFFDNFLKDKITLTGFELDLINALAKVANITVLIPTQDFGELVVVEGPDGITGEFDSFEGAFKRILELL
jgi:DNA polymerase-3 subunit epsilon